MERDQLLAEIKRRLQEAFGPRFRGLVLYGSEARGEAGPESDIDLMVLLDGPLDLWNDIRTAVHATYEIQLAVDRPLDLQPVEFKQYEDASYGYYRNARKDAVAV